MTVDEMKSALMSGIDRFRHIRTGREFALDPAQWPVLEGDETDDVLLVGFPVNPNPRQRGRKWQWLAPKNLEPAQSDKSQEA